MPISNKDVGKHLCFDYFLLEVVVQTISTLGWSMLAWHYHDSVKTCISWIYSTFSKRWHYEVIKYSSFIHSWICLLTHIQLPGLNTEHFLCNVFVQCDLVPSLCWKTGWLSQSLFVNKWSTTVLHELSFSGQHFWISFNHFYHPINTFF